MPELLRARLVSGELDRTAIDRAGVLLRAGRLVAVPTETVYGLGANALDAAAVQRIFAAKGRPSFNPLIVHVASVEEARALAARWPAGADLLAARFWPGPLTLVVDKPSRVPPEVTGGSQTVALRCPAHPVARAVIAAAGVPIAAPSANRSNAVSPTTAQHVLQSLGDRIDAVIDDGPCAVGIESTVVDVRGAKPVLLRPGGLAADQIERVIGPLDRLTARIDEGTRASPGLLSKHYAPAGHTRLVAAGGLSQVVAALPDDARIGVVALCKPLRDPRVVAWVTLATQPEAYARDLYAALHRMDAAGATHVLIEDVPAASEWEAVRDRITRAGG